MPVLLSYTVQLQKLPARANGVCAAAIVVMVVVCLFFNKRALADTAKQGGSEARGGGE